MVKDGYIAVKMERPEYEEVQVKEHKLFNFHFFFD